MTDPEKRQSVVFTALFELGQVTSGVFSPARVNDYWADVLHQAASAPHPHEWCGAFALYCLHQADLGPSIRWEFGPPHFGFLWNLQELAAHELPEPGDIGYQDKPYQHHFVVDHVDAGIVHTVEGNQGAEHPIAARARPVGMPGVVYFSIARLLSSP